MRFPFIEKILDTVLLPNSRFQGYINARFNKSGFQIVPDTLFTEILKDTYYEYGGNKYVICDQLDSLKSGATDYDVSDIRKTDIVLDIGANIGGFSLPISKKAKHVFAVEPIFSETLQKNIDINDIKNITVMDIGLGKEGKKECCYGYRKKSIQTCSLQNIMKLCGGHIDFLKVDCEGGEWSILPSELKGLRRIEAEIHHFEGMPRISVFEDILREAGFDYDTVKWTPRASIVHAYNKKEKLNEI